MFLNVKTLTGELILIEIDYPYIFYKYNQILYDLVSDKTGIEVQYLKLIYYGRLIDPQETLIMDLNKVNCIHLVIYTQLHTKIRELFGVEINKLPFSEYRTWSLQLLLHELSQELKNFDVSCQFIRNIRKSWEKKSIRIARNELDALHSHVILIQDYGLHVYNADIQERIISNLII